MIRTWASSLILLLLGAPVSQASPPDLATELVASGFSNPLWVGAPAGDTERLFVIEQNAARVLILDLATGAVNGADYLNLSGKVQTILSEQGLLGMAFDPDYDDNRFVYVNYTRTGDAATIVERYQTLATNPDRADPNSGVVMLGPVAQPVWNHNGGNLAFGPDGYLYVGLGDGGGAGDQQCHGQNGATLLGAMLRLDVSTVPASAAPGNPFFGDPNKDDRIWAIGLRNPWRYSFDAANGDLYIADVGQGAKEEVNWVPGASAGGENYGWNVMEGFNCFGANGCPSDVPPCNDPSLTLPVHEYSHAVGCSITGGFVYRGEAIPGLQGTYFFADFCTGDVTSFRLVNGAVTELVDQSVALDPPGALTINNVMSFGVDGSNELYICDQGGGEIYRVIGRDLVGAGLGYGKPGGNGLVPCLSATGSLATGGTASIDLALAPPNRPAVLLGSTHNVPTPSVAGTLVPVPPQVAVLVVTDAAGEVSLPANGGGGPFSYYLQYAIDDPGAALGVSSSNAFALLVEP